MHEGKVSLVVGVYEIVEELVNLDGCQLTLVDDVLARQGAEVEPIVQADGVRGPLPQHEEPDLEEPLVELLRVRVLGSITLAVGGG